MLMFSIRDSKANRFDAPFPSPTFGSAERDFRTVLRDDRMPYSKYPEDYALWHVGEWNEEAGEFRPEVPKLIISGDQVSEVKA